MPIILNNRTEYDPFLIISLMLNLQQKIKID